MAEISPRERVLLGFSPTSLSSPHSRSSDVDFSDVFGGPPRRSSTQESAYNDRNSGEFHGFGDNDGEGDEGWFHKLREKPVFGEVAGVRRRYTSDDFFDDIFRGDQPLSSPQSPRVMPRRSPFSSAPGSRAMSPSRSLPPADPFASPANFRSLPGRVAIADFTASSSLNQNSFGPSLSRFNQTTQNQDGGTRSSYRSDVKESTCASVLNGIGDQSHINTCAKGTKFARYTNIHFSIYKWESSGVPLVISLRKNPRSTDATKLDRCWSGSEKNVGVDTVFSENHTEHTPVTDIFSSKKSGLAVKVSECDDLVLSSRSGHAKFKDVDTAPAESNAFSVINPLNAINEALEPVLSSGLEAHNLSGKRVGSALHKHEPPKSRLMENKSSVRPLSSFLKSDNEGNVKLIAKKREDQKSMKKAERSSPTDDVSCGRGNQTKVQKASQATKNDACEIEATSKVKDFVKIFQECPSKASGPGLRQSQSRRWNDTKMFEVEHEIRSSSARMNDEMEASYVNWGETWPDTSEMEDGNSLGSQQFNIDDIDCAPCTTSQSSENAPNADNLRDSTPKTTSSFFADDVMVNEATKGHETKVNQWAKGKEGNIRALLSTLQYVLWPESGWKPIPLVDIIEANAVKRAYQKALLRLHPDKLQQKGAPPYQKLIAEGVFDILQEAWDQFNSLGSL